MRLEKCCDKLSYCFARLCVIYSLYRIGALRYNSAEAPKYTDAVGFRRQNACHLLTSHLAFQLLYRSASILGTNSGEISFSVCQLLVRLL